jgi:5'-3' exonuclease
LVKKKHGWIVRNENNERLNKPNKMTIALVDGDILVYRIGFSNNDELEHVALVAMDNYIEEILYGSQCSEYEIFLTGKNNFRKALYPAYKANRKDIAKPVHYDALRSHLIAVEGAVVSEGQEADDELGIRQTYESVICSIDKDLLMIPGRHYNFVRREHMEVTEAEGRHNFYMQLLTGDATDNIPGIYNTGPKKANDLLAHCEEIFQYNAVVLKAYKEAFPYCSEEDVIKHITLIGQLLWIRQEEGQEWHFELD